MATFFPVILSIPRLQVANSQKALGENVISFFCGLALLSLLTLSHIALEVKHNHANREKRHCPISLFISIDHIMPAPFTVFATH
jgi:hypothetical protein